jgi:hypothetical protein
MSGHETYIRIGSAIEGAVESNLFGKPCFKINGKPFICFFEQAMVFKLTGEPHRDALSLDGSDLFDPSGKGRPMKEWVQVPEAYIDQWPGMAQAAFDYVTSLNA